MIVVPSTFQSWRDGIDELFRFHVQLGIVGFKYIPWRELTTELEQRKYKDFLLFPSLLYAGVAWIITVDSVRAPGADVVKGRGERKESLGLSFFFNGRSLELCHSYHFSTSAAAADFPIPSSAQSYFVTLFSLLAMKSLPIDRFRPYPCIAKQGKLEHRRHHAHYTSTNERDREEEEEEEKEFFAKLVPYRSCL